MARAFAILLFVTALAMCSGRIFQHAHRAGKLSPVILVPGDGGCQMEARLNKPDTVHYYCEKNADFFNIWLNPKLLVPLVIDCWIDNVRLVYDPVTRTTSNPAGVTTRIPGFGTPDVVEWLDPSITRSLAGAYFKYVANVLVNRGYQRNVTLRGASYDFRKSPNENKQWFLDVKELVEETYALAGNSPVTFIVHSMGGPMTLNFLQLQSQKWKDKYVARLISLSGAWAGSAKAVKVFAMGDDLGSFALSGSVLRAEQITSPSLAWLMPSPYIWKPEDVLVKTPTRTFNMSNIEEFFILNYKDELKSTPTLVTGDGDGTVNLRSLKSCEKWASMAAQNNKPVYTVELEGADHLAILGDSRVLDYIAKLLVGIGYNEDYDANTDTVRN